MPAKGKTRISKERKAEMVALLPLNGNCAATVARKAGVSADVVERAAKDQEITAMAGVTKKQLAEGFASLTQKLLHHYEKQVDSADLDNKGTTLLGIVADKALLYANEPTSITANVHELRQSAQERLATYKRYTKSDEEALALLQEDAPELASALIQ